MKTRRWAAGLVFLSTLLAASGQLLIKMGADTMRPDVVAIVTNLPLVGGYCLYALSAAILIVSLKYGELSVLYPIYAMNFIWVAIMSERVFPDDHMNSIKWAGIIAIVCGVALIGLGSRGGRDG
jgi:multidrug transporter EmrE-like cation transporter